MHKTPWSVFQDGTLIIDKLNITSSAVDDSLVRTTNHLTLQAVLNVSSTRSHPTQPKATADEFLSQPNYLVLEAVTLYRSRATFP